MTEGGPEPDQAENTPAADTPTESTPVEESPVEKGEAENSEDRGGSELARSQASADDTANESGSVEPSDADVRDELPEDLDLAALDYGEYVFPNNNRRRVPAVLYVLTGLVALGVVVADADGFHLANGGLLAGAIALIAFGVYTFVAGWNLRYDERDALVAGIRSAKFPVGHASAQMGWRGLLSRPTWRILMYSNEPQPAYRGLVLVDGVDGEVLDVIIEENPEDWSVYDAQVVAGSATSTPTSHTATEQLDE